MKFHNYVVYKNYSIKHPTQQIDIVGIGSQNALVIDCKHWKGNSYTEMARVVDKQVERGILFMEKSKSFGIEFSFPVFITFFV
ncbi:MAG: NERD domain-containing protein [Candidatus Nitrosocosmicus sp.]|nr:NERD domain-containing protein [Candidatus Nitrosocosmicus sp.]